MMNEKGFHLIPSRLDSAKQEWQLHGNPQVITTAENADMQLRSCVEAYEQSGNCDMPNQIDGTLKVGRLADKLASSLQPGRD